MDGEALKAEGREEKANLLEEMKAISIPEKNADSNNVIMIIVIIIDIVS